MPASQPVPTAGRSVLDSAFALLGALEQVDGAGVTRLAAECGLPKTTAHRLLEQLSSLGAVERSRDGWRIGPRVFQLGHGWQPHPGLRAAVRDPMKQLAAVTGATVTVSVLRNGRELTVDWVAGRGGSPVPLCRAATWPWYTAAGKVLVAGARAGRPPGAAPVPVPAWWQREAERIRERGVAFDHEDIVSGVCCIAVPLYGAPRVPVASLCVIADPAHRLERLAEVVRQAGRAVSAVLKGSRHDV